MEVVPAIDPEPLHEAAPDRGQREFDVVIAEQQRESMAALEQGPDRLEDLGVPIDDGVELARGLVLVEGERRPPPAIVLLGQEVHDVAVDDELDPRRPGGERADERREVGPVRADAEPAILGDTGGRLHAAQMQVRDEVDLAHARDATTTQITIDRRLRSE